MATWDKARQTASSSEGDPWVGANPLGAPASAAEPWPSAAFWVPEMEEAWGGSPVSASPTLEKGSGGEAEAATAFTPSGDGGRTESLPPNGGSGPGPPHTNREDAGVREVSGCLVR